MTDNTLPEVGSRWTLKDGVLQVSEVRKRGRGYQVLAEGSLGEEVFTVVYRLADFRKQAKPA